MTDHWAVTPIFRFYPYSPRVENFYIFRDILKQQGVNLCVVEAAGEKADFFLEKNDADILIQLKTKSILWHKERLINIAVPQLPKECRYVSWIDADSWIDSGDWPEQAKEILLKENPVAIQLASEVRFTGPSKNKNEIEKFHPTYSKVRSMSKDIDSVHGSPGFAWMAKKQFFEIGGGLFDKALVGGGDLLVADAIWGNSKIRLMLSNMNRSSKYLWDYVRWTKKLHNLYGYPKGALIDTIGYHLYHDDRKYRLYRHRHSIIHHNNYNPATDLEIEKETGLWKIVNKKLKTDIERYFYFREQEKNLELDTEFIEYEKEVMALVEKQEEYRKEQTMRRVIPGVGKARRRKAK